MPWKAPFLNLPDGATVIISQFAGVSSFAAITNRLEALIEAIDDECEAIQALSTASETTTRYQRSY